MKIAKKSNVSASCESTEKEKDTVETVEDINDFEAEVEDTEEDIEAKTNMALAKEFYPLAVSHVKDAIDALGNAAKNGDKYAKQEIADLSVILLDLQNLQRMS
jgi:hypothetical protein